jgi:hypothetical protein
LSKHFSAFPTVKNARSNPACDTRYCGRFFELFIATHDFAAQHNTERDSRIHTRTASQTITSGYCLVCQHCSLPPQMLGTSSLPLSLAINRTAPEIPALPQDFRRRTFVAHLYRYSFVLCPDKTQQPLNLFNKMIYSVLTQIKWFIPS